MNSFSLHYAYVTCLAQAVVQDFFSIQIIARAGGVTQLASAPDS